MYKSNSARILKPDRKTFSGGLPFESGTLTDVDLDPKSLDFHWET
jgi:hypothetical protein